MKVFSGIRALGRRSALVAAGLGLAMGLVSTSAMSARPWAGTIIYYSDATHTEEVGRRYCGCNSCGMVIGTTSSYIDYEDVMTCY